MATARGPGGRADSARSRPPPLRAQPGDVALRDRRVQACELRDDSKVRGGWDVTMLQDGELRFSRRCVDERGARYVAQAFKQDTVRAGWVE